MNELLSDGALLDSWQALRAEIAEERGRLTVMEARRSEIELEMERRGVEPAEMRQHSGPVATSNFSPGQSWPTFLGGRADAPKTFDLEDEARHMLRNLSLADAAILFIEWAAALRVVHLPASPRQLLTAFPRPLRSRYHRDDAIAAEALRQQIARRTRSNERTILTYAHGRVSQKTKEPA